MIITTVNNKGGVGKTTLALHLAVFFAQAGQRVIAIDGDTQANLTSLLLNGEEGEGIYNLLVSRKMPDPRTLLIPVTYDGQQFALLPGEEYQDAVAMLAAGNRLDVITERLKNVAAQADVTILDMPPSKALGFPQLLQTADYLLIPTIMERLSIEGVAKIMETAAELRVRLMGIIPNKVRNVREHIEQGRELFGVLQQAGRPDLLWPPIPDTIRVAEAKAVGQTIFTFDPHNPAALALERVCERVSNVIGEDL